MTEKELHQLQEESLAAAKDDFYKYHRYGFAHKILTKEEWEFMQGAEILTLKNELAFLRGLKNGLPETRKTWFLEGEIRGFFRGFLSALLSVIAAFCVRLL